MLRWLDEYPDEVEIFIVMFIIPIIMNCLQLILIDNFIRNQVWFESNKLIRFKYPNFDEETASTRQREIDEILNTEREELDGVMIVIEGMGIISTTDRLQ